MRQLLPLCALALAYTAAQPPRPPARAPAPPKVEAAKTEAIQTIVLDVTRVNILYTVSDKKGRFVKNLTKDDFEIVEKKKKQNIIEFVAETDLPLRIGVLIDTSNSIRDRFRFELEAAAEFLNGLIRKGKDLATVVSFDTQAELVADLSDDLELIGKKMKNLRPGGGTSMYDAIVFACRDKLALDQPRHKFRRAIIMIGDGDDNASRYSRDQALEFAHKSDVVIYAISTNVSRTETDGDKVLKYFARETGGLAFFPFKAEDLAQDFENIANELRSQYSLLYRPEPLLTDGLYHEVELRVRARKDLVVRARKGYYAPRM